MEEFLPLRIGEKVPTFSARSTRGPIDFESYRGRWVILFAHPGDFTPVCTSEFIALSKAAPEFARLDCELLGISVDSLYSHLAWVRMIHDVSGERIEFPIIEDPTMEIARAYGMIGRDAPDAASVRTTYFIDQKGVLRASLSYPPTVGRSIPEMLRLLAALQRVDQGDALLPADWQPGDDLLRIPREDAADVLKSEQAADWFYSPKSDRS